MQYSEVIEKMEAKPGVGNRSLVIVLSGDQQRQEFCHDNNITYNGKTLPSYLWDLTHSAIYLAMEYQSLEEMDVLMIKDVAKKTMNSGRKAIAEVLEQLENDALVNMVTHIGINFAHSLGVIFTRILANGKSNLIKLEIDQSISGIPKPMEYSDEHSSVFVMPKISKDNARSAKVLARTLGLTVSATEQRIRETKKAIQEFCLEDEVFQEAWG